MLEHHPITKHRKAESRPTLWARNINLKIVFRCTLKSIRYKMRSEIIGSNIDGIIKKILNMRTK